MLWSGLSPLSELVSRTKPLPMFSRYLRLVFSTESIQFLKEDQKMNSIKLHSIAFAVILPCILALLEGSLIINLVGVLYILLIFRLSYTKPGKRFIRRYYKEILRLESLL